MQNSIWKLTALAGVVGIGFLVVLQAQRGLLQPESDQAETAIQDEEFGVGSPEDDPFDPGRQTSDDSIAFEQSEPELDDAPDAEMPEEAPGGRGLDFRGDDLAERPPSNTQPDSPESDFADEENPFAAGSMTRPVGNGGAEPVDNEAEHEENADAPTPAPSDENPFATNAGVEAEAEDTLPVDSDHSVMQAGYDDDSDRDDSPDPDSTHADSTDADSEGLGSDGREFSPGPRLAGLDIPNGTSDDESADEEADEEADEDNPFARQQSAASAEEETDDAPAELPTPDFGAETMPAMESADEPVLQPQPESSAFGAPAPLEESDETPDRAEQAEPELHPLGDDEPPTVEPEFAPEPDDSAENGEDREQPLRLEPPPEAAPLLPTHKDELTGEATVGADAPRGPQRPQLNIEKVAPPNAVLGQPLVYNILVKNVGNSRAREVVVEDRIPKGTELSGTIPQAEMSGKTLTWRIGSLDPGQERKIAVRVVPTAEGQIGSVATVNFVAEVAARTVITAPKLQLDLTAPNQAKLGQPVPFHFKVTNSGSGDAKGVILRDLIPDGLEHPAGNDLEYEIGTLTAGETREVTLTLTAAKLGEAVNRAILTAEGDVSIEAEAPLEVLGARLSMSRSGPKRSFLGRPAVYTNTVSNDSDQPAERVTVVETIPGGMEFVEATAGGRYSASDRTVAWSLDRLAGHDSQALQVTLAPKTAGEQTSVVEVRDSFGTRARVESQTAVEGFASLAADLSGEGGAVAVGEKITFKVQVRNRGTDKAGNVKVRLKVPDELEYVETEEAVGEAANGKEIELAAVEELAAQRDLSFTVVLKAVQPGDARLRVQIDADHMRQPLHQEEEIIIFSVDE